MERSLTVVSAIPHVTYVLRDFGNLPYHGLLDWRLALDMARIATSPNASIDLASDWNGATNPWKNLLEGNGAPIPLFSEI
jgi:hypothetical protein